MTIEITHGLMILDGFTIFRKNEDKYHSFSKYGFNVKKITV